MAVKWAVEMADEFKPEFDALDQGVRREILALARVLQEFGPQLGRPRVDTLNGSRHAKMKDCDSARQMANGEWLLLLIPGARRFYSWRETNPAGAKSTSTAN